MSSGTTHGLSYRGRGHSVPGRRSDRLPRSSDQVSGPTDRVRYRTDHLPRPPDRVSETGHQLPAGTDELSSRSDDLFDRCHGTDDLSRRAHKVSTDRHDLSGS